MPTGPGVTLLETGNPRHQSASDRFPGRRGSSTAGRSPLLTRGCTLSSRLRIEVLMVRALCFAVAFLGIASVTSNRCGAQDAGGTPGGPRKDDPVVFTTRQDHQD